MAYWDIFITLTRFWNGNGNLYFFYNEFLGLTSVIKHSRFHVEILRIAFQAFWRKYLKCSTEVEFYSLVTELTSFYSFFVSQVRKPHNQLCNSQLQYRYLPNETQLVVHCGWKDHVKRETVLQTLVITHRSWFDFTSQSTELLILLALQWSQLHFQFFLLHFC